MISLSFISILNIKYKMMLLTRYLLFVYLKVFNVFVFSQEIPMWRQPGSCSSSPTSLIPHHLHLLWLKWHFPSSFIVLYFAHQCFNIQGAFCVYRTIPYSVLQKKSNLLIMNLSSISIPLTIKLKTFLSGSQSVVFKPAA